MFYMFDYDKNRITFIFRAMIFSLSLAIFWFVLASKHYAVTSSQEWGHNIYNNYSHEDLIDNGKGSYVDCCQAGFEYNSIGQCCNGPNKDCYKSKISTYDHSKNYPGEMPKGCELVKCTNKYFSLGYC